MARRSPVRDGPASPEVTRGLAEATARILKVGKQPLRAAFLARALNALARLTPEVGERVLGDAAGAPSDYAVLLRVLEAPDVVRPYGATIRWWRRACAASALGRSC